MKEWKGRIVSIWLCLVLLAVGWQPQLLHAAGGYEPNRQGSITVKLEDLGTPMEGSNFALYQVGEIVSSSVHPEYKLTTAFAGTGVDLNSLNYAAGQKSAALTFMGVLPAAADHEAQSNAAGEVKFGSLNHGVYLVCQTSRAAYGTVDAYLVFLPVMNATLDGWDYDIVTSPKAEEIHPPVEIIKVDDSGRALAGASLELYDASGNLVDSWVSTGEAHRASGVTRASATYTLKEVKAPEGYLLSRDVVFTTGSDESLVTVKMTDPQGQEAYQVTVTKLVMMDERYRSLSYSFYAALFWDEACTQRATEPVELKVEESYTTRATIHLLLPGTYYLAETDAEGNVLDPDSDAVFFTTKIPNPEIILTPERSTASGTIINHLTDPPDGFLENDDGELTIRKQVRKGGKAEQVKDTFYFTLFADEELTAIIGQQSLKLEDESEGEVVFSQLAYGTYYLAETDEDGIPVGEDFIYQATVSEDSVNFNSANIHHEVTVTNELEPDSTETEPATETPKPTTPSKPSGWRAVTTMITKAVKTGDMTQILPYLLLIIGAVVIISVVMIKKRKKDIGEK